MSHYTKERNIITIDLNGVNGVYRLDINTGVFYGLRGKPVKTINHRSEIRNVFPHYHRQEAITNLSTVIYRLFDNFCHTSDFTEWVDIMQAADRIDALGVGYLDLSNEGYNYIGNNFKEFVQYMKTLEDTVVPFRFSTFKNWNRYNEAKKKYGSMFDLMTPEIFGKVRDYFGDNATNEEMSAIVYYCTKGKVYEYHGGSLDKLRDYIRTCRAMEKKPEKVNNFMREYCETKRLYELRKTEFDNKAIASNYQNQSEAWQFEHNGFIIQIPTCGQDLVTEGERMHHCVGGYVDNIIRGTCFICFVRKKENPDVPYITCQVHTNGEIGQYFLAYDNYISSAEDKDFYQAFQEHLKKVWKK